MSATFTASATFKAVDKVSGPMSKMSWAVDSFAKRSQIAFSRIEMQSRKLNQRFDKMLGTIGKLGLGFSGLMIAQSVAQANIELDASLASLSAVTGVTGKEFLAFSNQVNTVAKEQKAFAGDTAKAFEVVASAQPILLKNADALAMVTNATLTLAKASGDDLATSAQSLTGIMNQFSLGADQADRVMNVLAAGFVEGSASITDASLSMKNFGAVANASNISVEQSIALIQVMASKSIFAEEAGTKLRGSILRLKQAGMGYQSGIFNINDALTESKKKIDSLATAQQKDALMIKIFGAENITAGQIMLDNIGKFESLTTAVTDTTSATDMAATKSNTLAIRLQQMQDAFKNAVTTTDSQNTALNILKSTLIFVADHMDAIISLALTGIGIFIVYKAVVLGAALANNLMAASIAIGKFISFVKTIYLMSKATSIYTAAQWALNVALDANPLGLIVIAILLLIGLVTIIIKKWESWGSILTLVMGPLGLLIGIIQSLRANWDLVKASFTEGGILKGLLTIGKVILDAILYPVQKLLELLGKIPGLDIANSGAAKIDEFRTKLFDSERALIPTQKEELQTTNATAADESIKREERIMTQQATLNISNKSDMNMSLDNPQGMPIKLTSVN